MPAKSKSGAKLWAGAAQLDITPGLSVQLSGAVGLRRHAQQVDDPLYARALVLTDKRKLLCLVSLDLCVMTRKYYEQIRQAAAQFLGTDVGSVMIHATQTHSAPSLGHFMLDEDFPEIRAEDKWIRGGDERYSAFVVERVVEAIEMAYAGLQAVEVGSGSGIEGRMAYNRRAVKRDGSVSMPGRAWSGDPLGPTWILYIEGPIDPEVGVLCIRRKGGAPLGVLVNYACHPVHVFPKPNVSADWPGALAKELQRRYGEGCIPLVLNGACGNINPWPPFDPNYVEDHQRMGRTLAEMASKVIESMTFEEKALLDWRVKHLRIPFREIEPSELEEVRNHLEEHPEPQWADEARSQVDPQWMRAASVYSVYLQRQREGEFDYEVQVFRIGDTGFVGLAGEPFVEGGLRIKLASPAKRTFIVHMVGQYVGYVPTKEAIGRGGHEAVLRYWAKLVPEALDMITEAAGVMLEDLFEAPGPPK